MGLRIKDGKYVLKMAHEYANQTEKYANVAEEAYFAGFMEAMMMFKCDFRNLERKHDKHETAE